MTEVYKPRKGKQKKTNWGFFLFFKLLINTRGKNNQCKDRTLRSNEAFYETQWTLEEPVSGLQDSLTSPSTKIYQDYKTEQTVRRQTKKKTNLGSKFQWARTQASF